MQTIVYQCDTAMPAQKLPNCCYYEVAFYLFCFYELYFLVDDKN